MKKRKIVVRNKAAIYVLIGALVMFVCLGVVTYHKVSQLMIDHSKQSAMALAGSISGELDGDMLAGIRSSSDRDWQIVYDQLGKYRHYSYVKYLYTMRKDDQGNVSFIVDADTDDPVAVGEPYELLQDMVPAFEGEVCCDNSVSSDQWGSYYSAYAPVFDKDGKVVGIVGVDISIEDINSYLKILLRNLAYIVSTAALITMFIILVFSTEMSGWDMLTGLMNYEMVVKNGNRLKKSGQLTEYTAILMNIKGFKYINKQFGYDFGNELLKDMADFLKTGIKRKELISRTGNDNFFVLVQNENAPAYISRIEEANPVSMESARMDGLPAPVRCGVYRIGEEDTIEQVMGICTVVMNAARNQKKENVVFYNKEMYETLLEEGNLLGAYKEAIKNGEFKVYYQPKVDIENYTLCGAEALVRWQREGKLISPAQFIPLLEDEGLVTELDFYVFETVCNDIRLWKNQGIKPVPISTNFSKLHLTNPSFASKIVKTADRWHVEHEYLAVEMTESSGYTDQEALTEFVEKMNESGISVHMDDFGTGYSSLSMLGDVKMDMIKIDKSFVDRIFGRKANGAKLVENVIRMIHDLGREVICEGVETKEQVEFLKKTDCRKIQGYFFDKPLEHDEFTQRLENPSYEK
ncbi:MAG: EAL domain-containing protein [Lachnospiraceae bacterium]|nr:EAL domain-containing protein [Lachnospiraceae bacterium]